MKKLIALCLALITTTLSAAAEDFVAVIDMDMGIFPGTHEYLKSSIIQAQHEGAQVLVVNLDTPGGMLNTSQDIIKTIFDSPIPVIFYVGPSGATATSAGVFVTMAAHVAAMAPGTSIGAAHPVMGDGKDIPGDMRAKAENMTVAMVESIAQQRGRNVEWVKKAVVESATLTDSEAVKQGVVDLVAKDLDQLLKQIKGKEVSMVGQKKLTLKDYSGLPRKSYQISMRHDLLNHLADPQIAALLWLGATTGLSIELYNPGAILPAIVGIVCLILALLASQVIPINTGAIALLVVGCLMIGAELFVTSGLLGIGGIIAIVLGSIYIVDTAEAPGLVVNVPLILSVATVFGLAMFGLVIAIVRAHRRQAATGREGMIGMLGKAVENITASGRVQIGGEYWRAHTKSGIIEKGAKVRVISMLDGLTLEVERVTE